MSFFDSVKEILQCADAKYFVETLKRKIIASCAESATSFTREGVTVVVDEQINKLQPKLLQDSLFFIKEQIIDLILKELEKYQKQGTENIDTETEVIDAETEIIEDDKNINEIDSDSYQLLESGAKIVKLLNKKNLITPFAALEAVNTIANVIKEYLIVKEVETTKRLAIESDKIKYLAKVKVQQEFLMTYLEKTFDERSKNFEKFFKIVDNALERNDIQQLMLSVNAITDLAKSSPFKGLESVVAVQNGLNDKNFVWDF